MKRILSLALALCLVAGCAGGGKAPEPTQEPAPSTEPTEAAEGEELSLTEQERQQAAEAVTDLGLQLLCRSMDKENPVLSPASVLSALAMTAGGAAGRTLEQMERCFGLDTDVLDRWLKTELAGGGKAVRAANGLWLNSAGGYALRDSFTQLLRQVFDGEIHADSPFDEALTETINAWVREHTAGRIDAIVDRLDPDGAMVLVNALAFDGTWEEVYWEDQVRPGTFTCADGGEQQGDFLWSEEQTFLQDENAVGFLKYYRGRDYAFAALLPREGMTVAEYAASLTGRDVQRMLSEADREMTVEAAMPKFTAAYGAELSAPLADIGMTDAFDPAQADFSAMVENADGLFIGQVAHKSFLAVDERGTKAGAVSAVEMEATAAMGDTVRTVRLDRPFLYMLLDCRSGAPLFLGTVDRLN